MFLKLFEYSEEIAIFTGIFLTIAGFFNPIAELLSFLIGWVLVSDFLLTRIPSFLNKRFHTKAFTKDISFRLALLFFPSSMLTVLLLSELGFFMLPQLLQDIRFLNIYLSVHLLIILIFASIFYFSWRSWHYNDKQPNDGLPKNLWRSIIPSEKEFQWVYALSQKKGIFPTTIKHLYTGITPAAICTLLFIAWLIMSIFDVFLILFLFLLLVIPRNDKDRKIKNKIYNKFEGTLKILRVWQLLEESLWVRIFSSYRRTEEVMEPFMLAVCFLLLILPSIVSWEIMIVFLILNAGWYILIILIQLIRRRLRSKKSVLISNRKIYRLSFPKYSNLLLPSCLIMLVISSVIASYKLYSIHYVNLFILISSLALNILCLISIIAWLREEPKRIYDIKNDRYRLYAIFFTVGIPWAIQLEEIKGLLFWITLSGALILLDFEEKIEKVAENKTPAISATIITVFYVAISYTILTSVIYIFPQLSSIFIYIYILLGILLTMVGIIQYMYKRDETRKNTKRRNSKAIYNEKGRKDIS